MIKQFIAKIIKEAMEEAMHQGVIPLSPIPSVEFEKTNNPDHGDFSTSLPLRVARSVGINPIVIAEKIGQFIKPDDSFDKMYFFSTWYFDTGSTSTTFMQSAGS